MPVRSRHLQDDEEIYALIHTFQRRPTEEIKTKLVLHFEGLVHSLARRFTREEEMYEDLIQVGMIGLLGALTRFDPSYGKSFESFAVPTIIGEIKRYIRDKTWSVRVPRRIKELGPKIKKAIEELTIKYQRSPTIEEIASYLHVDSEEVLETLEMGRGYQALSVDSPIETDQEGSNLTLLDVVGEHEHGFEQVNQNMMLEQLFEVLEEREKEVLRLVFIEGLSQKEAGKRLNISQMHVSRLQRRAFQKLKDSLKEKVVY